MISVDMALSIATEAHTGQRDRANKPYILHPIRVGMKVATYGEDYMIVAFLHDVIEDTHWSLGAAKLKWGLTEQQLDALDRLTKSEKDNNCFFGGQAISQRRGNALRCKQNPISTTVKIADLEDNMDITRLKNGADLQQKDLDRINDYAWAWHMLTGR